jgi:hypothetical protein
MFGGILYVTKYKNNERKIAKKSKKIAKGYTDGRVTLKNTISGEFGSLSGI